MKNNELIKLLKNKHIQLLGVIFIIGAVLMITFGNNTGDKTEKVQTSHATANDEERLSDILSQIDGAGAVDVMITYYGTAEKDIAYETKTNSVGRDERSEESEDKRAVMTGSEPMVIKETYPEVKGVIIAAHGADKAYVRQAISEAVTAVLDVPAHRVCIYKKEE